MNNYFESRLASTAGYILEQLPLVTGSKGIVNQADIPVIMRYAKHLACSCKLLNHTVNHIDVMDLFLTSLSQKYGERCDHYASILNTSGARKWLWNHIQTCGDAQVYKDILDIYTLLKTSL